MVLTANLTGPRSGSLAWASPEETSAGVIERASLSVAAPAAEPGALMVTIWPSGVAIACTGAMASSPIRLAASVAATISTGPRGPEAPTAA